jgi:hypothetical protein
MALDKCIGASVALDNLKDAATWFKWKININRTFIFQTKATY